LKPECPGRSPTTPRSRATSRITRIETWLVDLMREHAPGSRATSRITRIETISYAAWGESRGKGSRATSRITRIETKLPRTIPGGGPRSRATSRITRIETRSDTSGALPE